MQDISKYSIIPRSKQKIIYNPVDAHDLPVKAEVSDLNEKKEVHFVAAGRLHWQKGFDRLIEALGKNPPKHNWTLKILGDGKDLNKLQHKISHYDLEEHIKLIGFQDNPWSYYSQADCFLLPSRTEGLPNVVLESLACGTPVIAMKEAGGIGEIAGQCKQNAVRVFDTIEAFVLEMHRLCDQGVKDNIDTSLPEVFSLDYAVHSLEALFPDASVKAGFAKKKMNGKNKA